MRTEDRLGWIGLLAFVTALGCAGERSGEAGAEAALADTPAAGDPVQCVADHPPAVSAADGHGGLVAAWGSAGDAFIVRRLRADCATVWEHREDGVERHPAALDVAADDRVLVGGSAFRSDGDPALLLLALDAGGALAWQKEIPGSGRVEHVAAAPDGGVVAAGAFDGPIDLGGGVLPGSPADASTLLVRYGATGRFLWSKVLGDRADVRVTRIAVEANGSVVVTGRLHDLGGASGPRDFKVVYDARGHLVASSLVPRRSPG